MTARLQRCANVSAASAVLFIPSCVYQLTALKRTCLRHSRSPAQFLAERWTSSTATICGRPRSLASRSALRNRRRRRRAGCGRRGCRRPRAGGSG
ncbi:MAG: DUF2182 domain-containing protein [Acidimicrobiales bacterium]